MPELSERIRGFVESAEPPVKLEEVRQVVESRPRRRRLYRAVVMAGCLAIVVVIVAAVVAVHTGAKHARIKTATSHPTVRAQLHQIALMAARAPIASPGPNQWLGIEQEMAIAAYVSQVGDTPTPDAKSTINVTVDTWADTTGQACVSASTQPALFDSPANQAAWAAAGLTDQPDPQPVTGCDSIIQGDTVGSLTEATGVIDVSALPTDPASLAQELETGTTGIPAVDQVTPQPGINAAFQRATVLLVGPDSGATSQFESALYDALATIPGVTGLGTVRSHSGVTGEGFSAVTDSGTTTIVVDPTSGALVEARNVADQAVFDVLSTHYIAGAGIGTEGGSYGATILWMDPVGKPIVVGPMSQLSSGDTAIYTIGKLGVTFQQIQAFNDTLQHEGGGIESIEGSGSSADLFNPHVPPATTPSGQIISIGATNTWAFSGTFQQVRESLGALESSGLFVTVLAF